jgi:hypothetical protein
MPVLFIVVYCGSNSIKGAPMPDGGNKQLRSWMFVPGNRDRRKRRALTQSFSTSKTAFCRQKSRMHGA